MTVTGASRLPYAYHDDTVHVQLRATAYRYGGGATDRGVQITLDSRHQGHTTAARMPRNVARLLALAILAEVDGDPGHVIDLRTDGWTIQHPLSCRPDLFACPVNRAAENDLTERPTRAPGRYVCALDDAGRIEIGDANWSDGEEPAGGSIPESEDAIGMAGAPLQDCGCPSWDDPGHPVGPGDPTQPDQTAQPQYDIASNPGDGPPYAQIRQIGRWTYRVSIHHGLLTWGPDGYGWRILGRRRAKRKAHQELVRYLSREAQQPAVVTVKEQP